MQAVTALVLVNNPTAIEWFAHKSYLEWTLDALRRVTALEDKIAIGILPALWDEVKPHVRKYVEEGRAIQFPGAAATNRDDLIEEVKHNFPESKRFIVTVPAHPLFPSEKYEEMFGATATFEEVVVGKLITVRQILPNGRALQNKGLWEARGIFARGLGHLTFATIEVDLTAVLDADDLGDRRILTKLVEG